MTPIVKKHIINTVYYYVPFLQIIFHNIGLYSISTNRHDFFLETFAYIEADIDICRKCTRWFKYDRDWFFVTIIDKNLLANVSLKLTPLTRAGERIEVVASLSQVRTAAAQCNLFTHKSVPVIFEPPCVTKCIQYSTKFHVWFSDYFT